MSEARPVHVVHKATVRTARYHWVGAAPADAQRVWIAMHGYGQLAARFLRPFADVVPPDTCVVAPEGLNRFYTEPPRPDGGHLTRTGANWLTREDRDADIADTHRWLESVADDVWGAIGAPAPTTGVLGFSQGVASMVRWLSRSARRPASVVVWAGGLPDDADAEGLRALLQQTTTWLVAGDADPLAPAPAVSQAARRLQAAGGTVHTATFTGEHVLHRPLLRELLEALPLPGAGG